MSRGSSQSLRRTNFWTFNTGLCFVFALILHMAVLLVWFPSMMLTQLPTGTQHEHRRSAMNTIFLTHVWLIAAGLLTAGSAFPAKVRLHPSSATVSAWIRMQRNATERDAPWCVLVLGLFMMKRFAMRRFVMKCFATKRPNQSNRSNKKNDWRPLWQSSGCLCKGCGFDLFQWSLLLCCGTVCGCKLKSLPNQLRIFGCGGDGS